MNAREISKVITEILNKIPNTEELADLRTALVSLQNRANYTAPEAVSFLWHEVAELLRFHFPAPERQNDWQRAVVAIWTKKP
jgi:hypothetical protein